MHLQRTRRPDHLQFGNGRRNATRTGQSRAIWVISEDCALQEDILHIQLKPFTASFNLILNIKMTLAIMIAVIFSLLTIIAFAVWRNRRTKKLIKLEIEPEYEMDAEDDERENIVSSPNRILEL